MVMKTEKIKTKSVEEYLRLPYSRLLVPDSNGGYSAEILEFPGCFSDGETAEEALENLEMAAANWVEAALQQGQSIPEPTGNYEYGGKIALRLPRGTHRKAIQLAEREGVSLNTFLVDAISARVGAEDVSAKIFVELDRQIAKINRPVSVGLPLATAMWDKVLDMLIEVKKSEPTSTVKSSIFLADPLPRLEATK